MTAILLEWSALWSAMEAAYRSGSTAWTATTADMYNEMLNALPPACYFSLGFCVGEAWNHNDKGEAVYAAFRRLGGEYEARYMTVKQAKGL